MRHYQATTLPSTRHTQLFMPDAIQGAAQVNPAPPRHPAWAARARLPRCGGRASAARASPAP
eukprot:scaffold52525_cov75-Phaeocystis_antarctica.AAC.4